MASSILGKLSWLEERTSLEDIGRGLGVSGRAVGYWTTGETTPTAAHVSGIDRLYERVQYAEMRDSGLAPLQAAKYRGLSPDTFDLWNERIGEVSDRIARNRAVTYLAQSDIDIEELPDEYLDALISSYYEGALDAIDSFGGDISEAEQYF